MSKLAGPLAVLNAAAEPTAPPAVLLPYQQRWVADESPLKIAEKGRRVGLTWGAAAGHVLNAAAAGGTNVFYISATQDMGREYIEACVLWARAFNLAASELAEGIYEDGQEADGSRRFIKTFEVSFPATGRRILALSSRPQNLRGKQGLICIDEAAFQNDLAGLLKAAMAMLLWGDRVEIISTHNGTENPFNQLIEEVRAGKRGNASVHRIPFEEAVAQGLYERVCLRKGLPWSQAAQDKWVADARAFYGDDAAEELDCIPNASSGAYLSLGLIEAAMSKATPVVRGKWDASFALLAEETRRYAMAGWIKEHIDPLLATLHKDRRHYFGLDFGRFADLTVFPVGELDGALNRNVRFVVELSNCPYAQQKQLLHYVLSKLPRFCGGAMDATGNGMALAEETAQRFGTGLIEQIKISETFYLENMPKLKAGLQDATLTGIPRDDQIRDDLRAIQLINGVPKIGKPRTQKADDGPKLQRHGDAAIGLLMLVYATFRQAGEIGFTALPDRRAGWEGSEADDFGGEDLAVARKGGW